MKLNNQYSTETKLEIFGSLCEFFSVKEILVQFPHLKLSESSGYALLSRNHEGLKAYKIQRNRNNKILEYENDINTLKKDVTEIRTALETLVNKLT